MPLPFWSGCKIADGPLGEPALVPETPGWKKVTIW
jgi:hypothetical protein